MQRRSGYCRAHRRCGLKGAAAYMEHARVLGQTDAQVAGRFHEIMAYLGTQPADAGALFQCAMDIGTLNYRIMEMLDTGETETFGEMDPARKHGMSHRADAFAKLVAGCFGQG